MEHVAGNSWLRTNCDSYGGNSGSAVIDATTKEVIGILVRGATDFKIKTVGGTNCFESVRFHENEGNEILTRPEVFKQSIP
jgi:V8-like Glu-specific endopeptidase